MFHPSQFDLDRFAVGELNEDDEAEIQAHIERCENCHRYLDQIEIDRAALLFRSPPMAFVSRVEDRIANGKQSRLKLGSIFWKGAAAAAAVSGICLLVLLLLPADRPETTQWRGRAVSVQVYLNRNGQTQTVDDFKPIVGDRLRYKVTLPRGMQAYAALVAVEDNEVLPLLPKQVDFDPFMITGESLLPGSVEIEPGNQSTDLLLVVRDKPFDLAGLIEEIRDDWVDSSKSLNVSGLVHRLQTQPGIP